MRRPAAGRGRWTLLFLDAEIYLREMRTVALLQDLERRRVIPPSRAVFVSHHDERMRDFVCRPEYSRFLVDELLPWLRRRGAPSPVVLVGLSLSGLAAVRASFSGWDTLAGVVSQSGSFWWNDETVRASLPAARPTPTAHWVSVGSLETEGDVDYSEFGMYQKASQLEACRNLATSLALHGHPTQFRVFEGGHDSRCWRDDLTHALPWMARTLELF